MHSHIIIKEFHLIAWVNLTMLSIVLHKLSNYKIIKQIFTIIGVSHLEKSKNTKRQLKIIARQLNLMVDILKRTTIERFALISKENFIKLKKTISKRASSNQITYLLCIT
jgi:hypothetical protein